jgi:hypothetical protein
MTKKSISITSAILIALSLPLAQAAVKVCGGVTVDELVNETLAKQTLEQVRRSAAVVADEADQLRMTADSKLSPEAHLAELTALKGEVNRMGQELGSLEAERESLAPWEQQALNLVLPLFDATAANTGSAIEYFSVNKDRLWTQTYREYADRVWEDSGQIAKTLKDYLKYDKLRDQEIQVEGRILTDLDRNAE